MKINILKKKNITYKKANKQHIIKLLSLYNKFYPSSRWNIKTIEWEYFNNPFGKARIFLALSGEKIVGITTSIPVRTKIQNNTYKGYRVQNVLVDKNYRGQGIFNKLLSNNNNYLDKCTDINISFPNEKSLPFFIKTNWSTVCKIPLFEKKIKKIEKINLNYKLIPEFTNIHKDIWEKNLINKLDITCSKKYLNWRFVLNPKYKYHIFEVIIENKPIGFIILKKYYGSDKIKIGHIVKLSCPEDCMLDVINFANNYFYNLSIKKISMWSINNSGISMSNLKFKRKPLEDRFFICRNSKKINSNKWNLSMSFSDVY